jgi:acyl-CoA thioesterase-1
MYLPKRSLTFILILILSCDLLGGCSRTRSKVTGGAKPDGSVIYAAIGDSTGTGLGTREGGYVERLFAKIKLERPASQLINQSLAGANTQQILKRQMEKTIQSNPTLVTIGIGMNDLLQGIPEDEFAKNYEEIVTRLLKTDAVIIVTTLPDLSSAPAFSNRDLNEISARLIRYNQRIEMIAERYQFLLIDVYAMSRQSLQSHPEFFAEDGLHPSDAGHAYWAEMLWPTVSKAIS